MDGISRNVIAELNNAAGIERCQGRKDLVQRGHIFLALLAFLRLEAHRPNTGVNWHESKRAIQRSAAILFIAELSF